MVECLKATADLNIEVFSPTTMRWSWPGPAQGGGDCQVPGDGVEIEHLGDQCGVV